MIEHTKFAKEMQVPYTVRVENGDIVKLSPGSKPEVFDKAPSGRLYVDGNVPVEEDSRSIKERRNISANGILDITILVTPKGNIHNKPILNYSGLPINNDQDYQYELENVIEKTTRTFSLNNQNQKENIIDAIKISCRKITKEITGKKPVTHIKLVRI
tara:strand:+ start:11 stop:484 length:474 start_codon:yes stop_codon:yes gene_type:complete